MRLSIGNREGIEEEKHRSRTHIISGTSCYEQGSLSKNFCASVKNKAQGQAFADGRHKIHSCEIGGRRLSSSPESVVEHGGVEYE